MLFGGSTKARLLEVLALNPGQTFHLRGLADAAGADSGNTSKMLRNLVDSEIVARTQDSRSPRYSLNERSPLAGPLRELIVRAGALVSELREVAQGLDARHVCIFGSVAAGTDDSQSDVDVLVVGSLSAVDAQVAFKAMGRKHGRRINAVAVQPDELPGKLAQGGAFWTSVAQGKRIDLKGAWTDVAIS